MIGPDDDGRRLDRICRIFLPDLPLSAIYSLIRSGKIRLDGKRTKHSTRVITGQRLGLHPSIADPVNPSSGRPGGVSRVIDQDSGELPVIWESRDIIVFNKPAGMPSHGEGGISQYMNESGRFSSSQSLAFRPAPLHRLDRNTSGAIAASRSIEGAREFSKALREGSVSRLYLAILDNQLLEKASWDDWLERDREIGVSRVYAEPDESRRRAGMEIKPLALNSDGSSSRSLALIKLKTGLSHQIRAQSAFHGFPLSGDRKYGGSHMDAGYFLHCIELGCPQDTKAMLPELVKAPLPVEFTKAIKRLFGSDFEILADKAIFNQ